MFYNRLASDTVKKWIKSEFQIDSGAEYNIITASAVPKVKIQSSAHFK